MDAPTVQFYRARASELAADYGAAGSAAAQYFASAFPPGSRVLDVGCGTGRDLQALIEAGYDATGVDAVEEMLRAAAQHYPRVAERMRVDSLPALASVDDASHEAVLCWAVLMHVPQEHLFDTAFNLRRVLKSGGRLLISTPLVGPSVDSTTSRDAQGRLFNQVTPENFHFLLSKVGFRLLNRWNSDDSLGRPDRRWATQLFVLEGQGSRSLERIEAILNRDKKDATYKPALFRALAELATTNCHAVRWLPEGRVAIPMRMLADKWVEYFWPLFESTTFIPQKRGERPGCLKPVAFRAELERLIALYGRMGGLCRFSLDYRNDSLPAEVHHLHKRLFAKLCDTIRDGPVYYAGGGGSKTFEYDGRSRCVIMEADLWRELSAMGSWIADATVLRWAELTAEISQGRLKASQVIDALLTAPIPEREVEVARAVYQELPGRECVWTGDHLPRSFEVDHAIPFSLWRNNDLWNLLPASRGANADKRDRLPTRALLLARRDCIIHYWSLMRAQHQIRFAFEVSKLGGPDVARSSNWETPLFNAVAEAVEFTAIQRGIERWEPAGTPVAVVPAKPVPVAATPDHAGDLVRIVEDPPLEDRFKIYVPFYDVAAAAGPFGPEQRAVDPHDHHAWIRVDGRRLTSDLFAMRVRGRSMEPMIPDGADCLFRGGDALAGSREGRVVLVVLRDGGDPETGGRLTVKRYHSEKAFDDAGAFRHTRIELRPLNPEFQPIVIEGADEDSLRVVGEFVAVLE